MVKETVGKIPEFISDETPTGKEGIEEVKEAEAEEVSEEEKETPAELPAEEKPTEEVGVDTGELLKQVQGLTEARNELLKEIQELRGQRRDIKTEELKKVEEKLDDLKDLHPDDVTIIERILRQKGYVTKDEAQKMYYDSVKSQELQKFLDKYPEYKPENDPADVNWNSLQKELGFYKLPSDPHLVSQVLEKAHKAIQKVFSDRGTAVKKELLKTASSGAGGTQRSSSIVKTLPPEKREILKRGGWSEEEIKKIEQNLSEEE